MTLKVLYIAYIVACSLLSITYIYWGIMTIRYRSQTKKENKTFCEFMFEMTDNAKWKERNISFLSKFYNTQAYSLFLFIVALIMLCVAIFLAFFFSKND